MQSGGERDFLEDSSLSQEEQSRAALLREKLALYDHHYYVLNSPLVSDAEYDELFRELVELEERHPALKTPDSPTLRVGAPVSDAFPGMEHRERMYSLADARTEEELREFDQRVRRFLGLEEEPDYSAEPKYDGSSLEVVYSDGLLVLAGTRGDGRTGEEVTPNARTIRTLPLRLRTAVAGRMDVRGEVIVRKDAFRQLNRELAEAGERTYANPRNFAAGSLRMLDPKVTASRPLEFVAWGVGYCEETPWKTHSETLAFLEEAGFRVGEREVVTGAGGLVGYYRRTEERRDDFPYEIDGVVFKLNELFLWERAGWTSRAPRFALAGKFRPVERTTVVRAVEHRTGRTGVITPIAVLEPVEVGGVTVTHASLHNYAILKGLDLRAGDRVVVRRAGDVIPELVTVIKEERPPGTKRVLARRSCPECRGDVGREGAYLVCLNRDCPAKLKGGVELLAGRDALDIETLGKKSVALLVDEGLIRRVSDLFTLPDKRERLQGLEGFGELSVKNLFDGIERAKRVELHRLLFGLGIPGVGETTARLLAQHYGSLAAFMDGTAEGLVALEGIGEHTAQEITRWTADPRNRAEVERMVGLGLKPYFEKREGPLSGKTFVLTGSLEAMTRSEAKSSIRQRGGNLGSGVTSTTDFVVVGDGPGSKLKKAEELGIKTLNEEEFIAMLRQDQ